jgi:hypothetical protein
MAPRYAGLYTILTPPGDSSDKGLRLALPRRAADDGVGDADREEVRAPVARRVGRELNVPALVRHAGDDEPDAGPVIELLVDEPQLRRVVAHERGGHRSAEAARTRVEGYRGRHGD